MTPEPEVRQLELLSDLPEASGIMLWHELRFQVTDAAGEPVPETEVGFTIGEGDGWLGIQALEGVDRTTLMLPTDEDGRVNVHWTLGPTPGVQTLEVETGAAAPLDVELLAEPGAVFVGVWEERYRDGLPSDTMRVHANFPASIREARERLEAGDPLHITSGMIRRGPAVYTAYIFHLALPYIKATMGPVWGGSCASPPRTEDALVEIEEHERFTSERNLCPDALRLVAIEEVPEWYLERLAEERFDSPVRF